MLFDSFVRQRGNGKVLESALQHSKLVNNNGAKMVDVWNVVVARCLEFRTIKFLPFFIRLE